ncbi:LamG domain-containing protein [Akkermansiaceae bacterium]|nr:LamG domain-containing protein [Akkermansiaceae bacterium]
MNYQTNPSWRSILAVPLTLLPFSAQSELIGYFKLDGNFDDSSGNGNTGELFGGASYIAESPAVMGGGQSVVFDGQPGTYGAINSSPKEGLAITAQPFHSVSMWVKADGLQNQDKRIFSEARADSNDPLFNVGTANNANNGTVDIYIRNGGSLNHPRSIGEAFDGTWHHVAWTAQGKVMDLYIDGVFDSQFDYNAINDFIPTTTTIGGDSSRKRLL